MVREEADKAYSSPGYDLGDYARISTNLCAAHPRVDSRNNNPSGLREPGYLLSDEDFNEFRDRVPIKTAEPRSVVESADRLRSCTLPEACNILGCGVG